VVPGVQGDVGGGVVHDLDEGVAAAEEAEGRGPVGPVQDHVLAAPVYGGHDRGVAEDLLVLEPGQDALGAPLVVILVQDDIPQVDDLEVGQVFKRVGRCACGHYENRSSAQGSPCMW